MANLILVAHVLALAFGIETQLANTLAATPQMGWNSWNHFGCGVSEELIRETVDAIKSRGLDEFGYTYVNIDDCWSAKERNATSGELMPDPKTFPNGIKALADYTHGKGLKLGIYSDAGNFTCQKRPGSLYHEQLDADTFASWEIDYLKYDNCYNEGVSTAIRYPAMATALQNTGREIFYSICNWGQNNTYRWAPAISNSWRTTLDIKDIWLSMKANFLANAEHPEVAGPGHWNDPDMLEVGNGGMTYDEYVSHFSLWVIVKAPLIIGCDIRHMDEPTYQILTNKDVIDINQDKLGRQGMCYNHCDTTNRILMLHPEVWVAPLENGDLAVLVMNWGDSSKSYTLSAQADLRSETKQKMTIRDLWLQKDLGEFYGTYSILSIPAHGVKFFRIRLSAS